MSRNEYKTERSELRSELDEAVEEMKAANTYETYRRLKHKISSLQHRLYNLDIAWVKSEFGVQMR